MSDIDIVIAWVDDHDEEWRKSRNHYLRLAGMEVDDASKNMRFRDWDNMQYIFRGIEKYMPWVRTIHFVTVGHVPKWLEVNHPKLHIVRHEEFIPKEYLPTFNSAAITLNLHRIPGLAENFIFFNDDMFVIKDTKPEDFFINGLPRDMACLSPVMIFRNMAVHREINNLQIINDHFTVADIKRNKRKWYSLRLYKSHAIRSMIFSHFNSIIGIFVQHIPISYCKHTYEVVWEKEREALDFTCRNKFRTPQDNNDWVMREWQLVSGEFIPRKRDFGILIPAGYLDSVRCALRGKKYTMVCINDGTTVEDFETAKAVTNEELERIFPEKSGFEKR